MPPKNAAVVAKVQSLPPLDFAEMNIVSPTPIRSFLQIHVLHGIIQYNDNPLSGKNCSGDNQLGDILLQKYSSQTKISELGRAVKPTDELIKEFMLKASESLLKSFKSKLPASASIMSKHRVIIDLGTNITGLARYPYVDDINNGPIVTECPFFCSYGGLKTCKNEHMFSLLLRLLRDIDNTYSAGGITKGKRMGLAEYKDLTRKCLSKIHSKVLFYDKLKICPFNHQ